MELTIPFPGEFLDRFRVRADSAVWEALHDSFCCDFALWGAGEEGRGVDGARGMDAWVVTSKQGTIFEDEELQMKDEGIGRSDV